MPRRAGTRDRAPRIVRPAHNRVSEETCREKSRSRIISRSQATLGDSQVFGAHVWSELGPRLLDFQDKRLRLMDAAGVEIMIASLNAPAIQAIPDTKRATSRWRARPTTCWRRKSPSARTASSALRRWRCRTRTARRRSCERCVKQLGFRGALVNGFSQVGSADTAVLLRSAAVSAVLARGRAARRSVLSASAQSAAGLGPRLRGPRLAARAELGVRMPRPRCMRCG